ncbi:MAG TPA: hypothetical protein VFU76_07570 [Terriglobales bacterium]|nr:hypothetical protein [Terriglobales bacterium]
MVVTDAATPAPARRDYILLASLATAASLIAFLHYQRTGALLLYGDAVAHINIARRVFDSRTPGPLQLGTVWLPLPHLLILPFIIATPGGRVAPAAQFPRWPPTFSPYSGCFGWYGRGCRVGAAEMLRVLLHGLLQQSLQQIPTCFTCNRPR